MRQAQFEYPFEDGLPREPGNRPLPLEVRQLLTEAVGRADGNQILALALLQERLICDASISRERAVLVRWLADQPCGDRLPGAEQPVENQGRSA